MDKSTCFKPKTKIPPNYYFAKFQRNKIDNVLTPYYTADKVRVTNIDVRNQVANWV